MRMSPLCLLSLATVLVLGCRGTDSPVSPTAGIRPRAMTTDMCDRDPNCSGVHDPAPTEPGIYLGSAINFDNCDEGAYSPGGDVDQDGFGDYCEQVIAQQFAPLLQFDAYESASGLEPYWVVRPEPAPGWFWPSIDWTGEQRPLVKVMYALSYYVDAGQGGCSLPACGGHLGDSEWIELLLAYQASTQHWIVRAARLTAHGFVTCATDGAGQPIMDACHPPTFASIQLEYPNGHAGSYPRVWISRGKHANYPTQSACKSGGFFGSDDCAGPGGLSLRVPTSAYHNLGSSRPNAAMRNCVLPENNAALRALNYSECYWTAAYFTGWSGDNSGHVAGYGSMLRTEGY